MSSSVRASIRGKVDTLVIDNQWAQAEISLFGAQVLSFVPKSDGRDRLWVSEKAIFDNVTPIRGGIPICWPWFSNAHPFDGEQLPSHGFVRNQLWRVDSIFESESGTQIDLSPTVTRQSFYTYDVTLNLTVIVGDKLTVLLKSFNNGSVSAPVSCALHSYFSVEDINSIIINGLTGLFKDKTKNWEELETPIPYRITQETDRIHAVASALLSINQKNSALPTVTISPSGHDSIVIWNPWQDLSKNMKDMADDSFKTMVCIENAQLNDIWLEPKTTRVLSKSIF